MKTIYKIRHFIHGWRALGSTILLIGASSSPAAEVAGPLLPASSSNADSGWHFYWPTYLWAAGVTGTTRTLPQLPASKVDMSFTDTLDLIKDVEGALVTTVYAHKGRFLLMLDLSWTRVSPSQTANVAGTTVSVESDSDSLAILSGVGYRLVDNPKAIVDVYLGVKVWSMDNTLSVDAPPVITAKLSKAETWVDGLVGGQIRSNITDRVFASAIGFAGTGGSKFIGDLYAGVGYQFNKKWDAFVGYRVQHVDYENGSFLYDITQQGPLLGVAAKF